MNYQIPQYVSWHPDPEASALDAFSIGWEDKFICAFPPFSLIPQVLQKLEQDQAIALMIVPNWPTQPWFAKLIHLLIDRPVILPEKNNVYLPSNRDKHHPLGKKLKLMACVLSLESHGLSSRTQETILNSWRQGMKKQYRVYLEKWQLHANQRGKDPLCPPLSSILTSYRSCLIVDSAIAV